VPEVDRQHGGLEGFRVVHDDRVPFRAPPQHLRVPRRDIVPVGGDVVAWDKC
jgi:hypothetical protein